MRLNSKYFLSSAIIIFYMSCAPLAHAAFIFFGEHPFAPEIATTNTLNDQIEDLMLYEGTLYAGYGTHSNHTFDTRICGFTPPSNIFSCPFSVDSEGAGHFRNIDNKLYIAGIDPRAPNSHFYVRKSGTNWFAQSAFTPNVAHVYDIESAGGNVFVTVSKFDDDSRVMKGTDGGTWVESLNVTLDTGHTTTNYSILFFVAEYQGALYTHAYDTEDGIRPYWVCV